MLTEKGSLPVGIEYAGKVHREFEIREQRVRDLVAVYDNPETARRAESNDAFMGLCILAGQVVSLGEPPGGSDHARADHGYGAGGFQRTERGGEAAGGTPQILSRRGVGTRTGRSSPC